MFNPLHSTFIKRFRAGQGAAGIARLYGVPTGEVKAVIKKWQVKNPIVITKTAPEADFLDRAAA